MDSGANTMSYQELPVQMPPRYQEFLKFMADCPHRKTPECMQTAFWAWFKIMSELCGHRWIETDKPFVFEKAGTDALKNDLDRLHRERDSFQEQARCLAESSDTITDYAIFQAISDLERVCRHRTATQSEDWLQIESEDRTTKPVIEAALIALKAANVELKRREKFPNVLIVYDRSQNKFFGKS